MGFQPLCRDCHGVKHILSVRNCHRFSQLAQHFMEVNQVGPDEFRAYLRDARRKQAELNRSEWRISFGDYSFKVPPLRTFEQRKKYVVLKRHEP